MEQREIQLMHQVEEEHWWFVGKRLAIMTLLKGLNLPSRARVLDLGCGTGATLNLLSLSYRALGLELDALALTKARQRNFHLVQGHAGRIPLAPASMDLVLVMDLLYHRNLEPASVLGEVLGVLKPGGRIIIFDAAYQALFGPHDASMHGARRFTRPGMRLLLERAGFQVQRVFYRNTFIAPAVIPIRLWARLVWRLKDRSRRPPPSDVQRTLPWLNHLMQRLMALEAQVIRRLDLPFGVTVCALAKKPG